MEMKKLSDCFWIWGHDAGCHHLPKYAAWKIPGENKMGPVDGAAYLGIPNCCRVVFGGSPKPPFDAESEKLLAFKNVVWSIVGDASSHRNDDGGDDLDEVLRQAQKYPNIVGGILDDFFRLAKKDARMSVARLKEIRDRLHNAPRPLKLFLVYYAALFEADYSAYLDLVDVISFWSWDSAQLADAEQNLARLVSMTPGKKRMAGCYIYNYGDCRPITLEEMKFQLGLYRKLLLKGDIHGVIVCSNNIADLGLDAPEYLKKWLEKHGNEEVRVTI